MQSAASFELGIDDARAGVLHAILRDAGERALSHFGRYEVSLKADGTKVTNADLAAHDAIVAALAEAFPADIVTSEEAPIDVDPRPGQGVWYVDPIDGTGAFTEGLAHWGPTLVRLVDGCLDIGALYIPRLGEFYIASVGRGAWRNGQRLHAQLPNQPARLHTLYVPSRAHRTFPLAWPGKIRALGCTAAHLAMIANGSGAAALVPLWAMWDVGCGILLAHESGAQVVDLHGEPFDAVARPGEPFVVGDAAVLPALLSALRDARSVSFRS